MNLSNKPGVKAGPHVQSIEGMIEQMVEQLLTLHLFGGVTLLLASRVQRSMIS